MRELLLGVDVGTSACKIAFFDRTGQVIAASSADYTVFYPHTGWAEQDAQEWWIAVCDAIHKAMEKGNILPAEVCGIGIDGQGWSSIPVDGEGNVLARTPIWMDMRSADICDELNAKIGEDKIFEVSGNPLQATYTTAKIIWLERNNPEAYAKTQKILQANTFIAYRLTGEIVQDICTAYGFHCFNMREGRWDYDMCRELGIPSGFLSEICECCDIVGTVTEEAAAMTGLAPGIPVVAGGLDAACGALGAGVVRAGETQEQGGQAGGMSICMDNYVADPRLILGYHVVPGKLLLQGGTVGGGGVMRWLEAEFGAYERSMKAETGLSSLEQFNVLADKVPAGSDGLVFLPYMSGERSPIWDPKAKGVFFGLDFSKTKGHLIRSAMEGVVYALKHNIDLAEATGAPVSTLRSMGGAANSLLWTQMKSDITGKPIIVPTSDTATTLGAAMLAGVAVGMYPDFETAVAETVKDNRYHYPNMELHEKYKENFEIYLELYEKLKDTMHKTYKEN